MTRCELCKQGDPSYTVRCWLCGEQFHIHQRQLNLVGDDTLIMADCPSCGAVNCWRKQKGRLAYSGPVINDGQPIIDLRMTKMRVECAWCGKDMGEKDGGGQTGTTHGICEECKEKELAKLEKYCKSGEGGKHDTTELDQGE